MRLARRIKRDTVEKGRDIATVLDQVCVAVYSCFAKNFVNVTAMSSLSRWLFIFVLICAYVVLKVCEASV